MSALLWNHWSAEWSLAEKVSFNGYDKTISVNSNVTTLDIMSDVYSAWVRWVARERNFLPAIRYSGFDPIPGGRTGVTFFLINGWKLLVNLRSTKITGVLYSEDYSTAYFDIDTLLPLFPAEVTSVVNTVYSDGGGASISAADVWSYNNRTITNPGPNAIQIRQEIDNNSTQLADIINKETELISQVNDIPTAAENAQAIWSEPISGMNDKTTIGGYISKVLLSIPKFLGMK